MKKMNLNQTQQFLGARKLTKRGKKKELVNRLIASLKSSTYPASNVPPIPLQQHVLLMLNTHGRHLRLKLLQSNFLQMTPSQTLVKKQNIGFYHREKLERPKLKQAF